ncbi:MAG: pyridoxal-phosphate dependent enzyme [Bacteroidetes bacterium]|nr:pyridoxal-phosphate dependent enzyme [Bacteroidota bacterium]
MIEINPLPSPLHEIRAHPGDPSIRLFVKRDDLIHPTVSGNKWRKLHLAVEKMFEARKSGIISMGGPFSNHLHALAAYGNAMGFPTLGIIRGNSADLSNPTLSAAGAWGMQFRIVSKKSYDLGLDSDDIQSIIKENKNYMFLPEGGSSREGVLGCMGIGREVETVFHDFPGPRYLCVPAGTGCTAAGAMLGLNNSRWEGLVFPAAPYGVDWPRIDAYIRAEKVASNLAFKVTDQYTFGSFVTKSETLHAFIADFKLRYALLLDPIYTCKMMYGIFDLLGLGYFPANSLVVAVHTGGLQGWDGIRREVKVV